MISHSTAQLPIVQQANFVQRLILLLALNHSDRVQKSKEISSPKIMVKEMAELAVGVDIPIEFGVYGVYLSAFAVLRSSAVMQGAGQAPIDLGTCGESSTSTVSHEGQAVADRSPFPSKAANSLLPRGL
jgi:hypothetical protein